MLYEHLKPNFVSMVKVVNQSVTKHFQSKNLQIGFQSFIQNVKKKVTQYLHVLVIQTYQLGINK